MTQTFTHDQLLAPDISLLLDEKEYTISMWQAGEHVCQQSFTEPEYRLLALLLTRGTAIHCSYEEALSLVTHQSLDTCQEMIQAAKAKDEEDETHRETFLALMNSVIETFEACQERLHQLGLDVRALIEYGYVLVSHQETAHAAEDVE